MNKKELGYKRNQYAFCLNKLIKARRQMLKAEQEVQRYGEQLVQLEAELKPFIDTDLSLEELLKV